MEPHCLLVDLLLHTDCHSFWCPSGERANVLGVIAVEPAGDNNCKLPLIEVFTD